MKTENRKLTRDEYITEMTQRWGPVGRYWKCQCPVCGIIYSLADCGTDADSAQRGLFGCIGRINGKGGTAFGESPPNEHGCDFAANGLFRSPWLIFKSKIDEDEPTGVMPIAPPDETDQWRLDNSDLLPNGDPIELPTEAEK